MNTNIVGSVKFGNHNITVYNSLDEPLFRAADISDLVDYSEGNTWKLLGMCEKDEKLNLPLVVAGQRRTVSFVTEMGLYNVLSQSRMPLARMWRHIIHKQLIEMRKSRGVNIEEQFEEWDHALDDLYYDEETGFLMQSITTAGGDAEQVAVKEVG